MVNTETGEARWKQKAFDEPRPLYNLPKLAALDPGSTVVVVEGEKCADAVTSVLAGTGIVAISWAGGSKALKKTDWKPLRGHKVVFWPDCDSKKTKEGDRWREYQEQPGMMAMLTLAKARHDNGDENFRIVKVPYPGHVDDGWDAADAIVEGWGKEEPWGKQEVLDFIRENTRTYNEIMVMNSREHPQTVEPDPVDNEEPPPYDEAPPNYEDNDQYDGTGSEDPFQILALGS